MSAASKPPHVVEDVSRFVLPSPIASRQPGRLLVGTDVRVRGTALLRQQAAALAALGERLTLLANSQATLLHELRLALAASDDAVADALSPPAARIAAAKEVLAWCDAAQEDLAAEAARAVAGEQQVDLLRLCHDVVHDYGLPDGAAAVNIHGLSTHPVWGNVRGLAEVIRLGVCLAAQRSPGGAVHVDVDGDSTVARVRICSASQDSGEPDALAVEAFRAAVAAAGVGVAPDASGRQGAGMVLSIPAGLSTAR